MRAVRSFAVLAYGITWLLLAPWFYLFTVVYRQEPPAWLWLLAPVAFIGGWGPSVAAILTAARHAGGPAVRRLLASLLIWRVGVRWYLLVFLLPPLLAGAALVIVARDIGAIAQFNVVAALASVPLAYAVALPFGPLGEELGWRGFALPKLLESMGHWRATLVLGVMWTFWHVPMMLWFPGASMPAFMPLSVTSVVISRKPAWSVSCDDARIPTNARERAARGAGAHDLQYR